MADADADAAKIGAEAGIDRAQAVMARRAAADAHLDLERREVELVVEDGERVDVELVEAQRLLNRVAAVVHEGLRLEQQDALAADAAFRDQAAELLRPGPKAVRLGDDVGGHEADIVPLERILRAGIAEADPELHRRSASVSAAQKETARPQGGRFLDSSRRRGGLILRPPAFAAAFAASPSSPSSPTVGTSPSAAASSSSAFIADGATMVATVKSSSVRRADAVGQLDLADVDRIADLEPGERDVDLARDAGRVADQLELVAGRR